MDLYEVNEAFAPVPMAWLSIQVLIQTSSTSMAVPLLGHPLGATGTKLMTTLVHALHARGKIGSTDDV